MLISPLAATRLTMFSCISMMLPFFIPITIERSSGSGGGFLIEFCAVVDDVGFILECFKEESEVLLAIAFSHGCFCGGGGGDGCGFGEALGGEAEYAGLACDGAVDRKSTRLNSSH